MYHPLRALFCSLLLASLPARAWPQAEQEAPPDEAHQEHAAREHEAPSESMSLPLGVPMARSASGTSWQPDSTPMFMLHTVQGRWMYMFQENLFGVGSVQSSARGDLAGDAINWVMGMAQGPLLGGQLVLRSMFSLEPFTVGPRGYPLLLQTGEEFEGEHLVDRQHPHDLFMELALLYRRALGGNLGLLAYGGPVGEPALGPTAYPHRISALPNPLAPLSHHWLDSTHIAFGVITLGVFTRRLQLEGSVFNGREPSGDRTDLEFAPLDSFSGRLSWAPTDTLSLQVSAGRLISPEILEPGEDATRLTASVTYNQPLGGGGHLASTLAAGTNIEEDVTSSALLWEASLATGGANLFFGRAEIVGKPGEDLEIPTVGVATVGAASLGYLYERDLGKSFVFGVGIEGTLNLVPSSIAPVYGGRALPAGIVFFRIRPALSTHKEVLGKSRKVVYDTFTARGHGAAR